MMKNVYHYDGVTKTSILESVVKLTAKQGVYPDFGKMELVLTYPVLNPSGSVVTLEKGDLIWSCTEYSTNQWFTHGLGIINDIKRSGDLITVKAESILEPLMRMRYTVDNSLSGFVTARIWDIITKYTPPHGIAVSSWFLAYRRETGPATWNLDTMMGKVVHGMEVDVKAYFQYLIEQPVNLWLEKPTGTIFPVYNYNDNVGMPNVAVGFSGYGNHRQADKVLSYDAGVLSKIEWQEPTDSVLNDVTITVRGGGKEQLTDAASIAAYGRRQTSLVRGIYTEDAIGGYDATWSLKSIVKSMCVPHKRCRLTCEINALLNNWQTVGGMYRVIDELTGQDEYMALRSFTYRYPEEIAECEFDNAPLDMSKYGMRMENRVTSLESNMVTAHANFYDLQGGISPNQYYHLSQAAYNNLYQQDQGVKTTSSPTFAASTINGNLTITGTVDGVDVSVFKSDYDSKIDQAVKTTSSPTFASANITGAITTGQNSKFGLWQFSGVRDLAYNGKRVMVMCEDWSPTTLVINYGGDFGQVNIASPLVVSGNLTVRSAVSTSDMGLLEHTGATASDNLTLELKRTNQTGTQLYLDLWDSSNGKRGGINVGAVRINNTTVAIDGYNDHFARYMNLTGTGNQFRCDNRIVVRNTNNTAYQDVDMKRLYISGTLAVDEGRNASLGSVTASGSVQGQIGAYLANTQLTMSASSTVQYNNATYRSTTTTSSPGSVLKRLKVNYAMTGTFYIKWSLVSQGTGITVYGILYKNGSALGSTRSTLSTDGVTFTEGPYTDIAAGDEFQIQAWTSDPSGAAGVWDMQICFTPSTVLPLYSASV